jgi:transcriptional regulator of met regulon
MANNNLRVDLETLKTLLVYDPATGYFTWLPREGSRSAGWNRQFAGKIAGCGVNGYAKIGIRDRPYRTHRLAWFYMTGRWPLHEIDHINQNRTDNRWSNLREATTSQNLCNRARFVRNKSGYKGVALHKHSGLWKAEISFECKRLCIGYYKTPEAAYGAYCEKAKELHGEFARFD